MPSERTPNPLPCGCGIKGTPRIDFDARQRYENLFIDFCPLHFAAPELSAALDTMVAEVTARQAAGEAIVCASVMKQAGRARAKARPAKPPASAR